MKNVQLVYDFLTQKIDTKTYIGEKAITAPTFKAGFSEKQEAYAADLLQQLADDFYNNIKNFCMSHFKKYDGSYPTFEEILLCIEDEKENEDFHRLIIYDFAITAINELNTINAKSVIEKFSSKALRVENFLEEKIILDFCAANGYEI